MNFVNKSHIQVWFQNQRAKIKKLQRRQQQNGDKVAKPAGSKEATDAEEDSSSDDSDNDIKTPEPSEKTSGTDHQLSEDVSAGSEDAVTNNCSKICSRSFNCTVLVSTNGIVCNNSGSSARWAVVGARALLWHGY